MGKVLLNTGQQAEIPYRFEKLGLRVYSIEELCYCLKENAFLLDRDIVSKKLADWIHDECGLPELAKELYGMVNQRSSLSAFVAAIFTYAGYYEPEVVARVEETLKEGASLNDYEKKKKRVDFFVENQRYGRAILEYDRLLAELPPEEKNIRADVIHNKGTALTGLFLFDQAAELFREAWELKREERYYRDYLAAKRMFYDDKEYIEFVAGLPEAYESSLQLEREVDSILENWETGEEQRSLSELFSWKEQGNSALYYEEVERRSQALKDKYRAYSSM